MGVAVSLLVLKRHGYDVDLRELVGSSEVDMPDGGLIVGLFTVAKRLLDRLGDDADRVLQEIALQAQCQE